MIYYMYLQLAKSSLTVFDCSTKDDGVSVLDIEPAMECSLNDPTYQWLFPLAVLSLIVYVVGIPLSFGIILYRFRHEIKADQTLRIQGLGGSRRSNPNYDVRRRFQKLYNDFRPEMFFWRLILMGRKLALVRLVCSFVCVP